jgi:hypothetical protein
MSRISRIGQMVVTASPNEGLRVYEGWKAAMLASTAEPTTAAQEKSFNVYVRRKGRERLAQDALALRLLAKHVTELAELVQGLSGTALANDASPD